MFFSDTNMSVRSRYISFFTSRWWSVPFVDARTVALPETV